MSVESFGRSLYQAKLGKNDKEWFPRWIRRYASSVKLVEGRLPVSWVQRFIQHCGSPDLTRFGEGKSRRS